MQSNADVAPHFIQWKDRVGHLATPEAEFGKWLFVRLAAVLFDDKAGELLNLPPYQFGLSTSQQVRQIDVLASVWRYSYRVLYQTSASVKVVFYRADRIEDSLSQVPPCILHEVLQYQHDVNAESFVAEIGRRWQRSGDIPHEIGLALGYPVKDVLGYMGLLPLKCLGCCGWQIYDDPDVAHGLRRRFQQAQRHAHAFLTS